MSEFSPHPTEMQETEKTIENLPDQPFDSIMVFGHGWSKNSFSLSPEAKMRATAAYQLWKNEVAPRIILTGGEPNDWHRDQYGQDIVSNASQMKRLLTERFNVPDEAILMEELSTRTVDNVAHALNVLDAKQLPAENFVTVSTGYHMKRITKIMDRFGLESHPVAAEDALTVRAQEHADRMKANDIAKNLPADQVEKNWEMRSQRYDRMIDRIKATNEQILSEVKDEPHWTEAMEQWSYWGPLALAVRGDKLRELIANNHGEIETWLERHPEIEISMDDLIEGNFDYMELVKKGRELPPLPH